MSCYFKSCERDRPITCLQKYYKAEKQAMRLGLESHYTLNPAPKLTKYLLISQQNQKRPFKYEIDLHFKIKIITVLITTVKVIMN